MEQLTSDNNENKRQLMTITSSQESGIVLPPDSYNEMMMLMVHDSFTASAQTPTLAEKMERAEVWGCLLFGLVPEHRLQECFDTAFREHQTAFPLTAYDLKAAWDNICNRENNKLPTAEQKLADARANDAAIRPAPTKSRETI